MPGMEYRLSTYSEPISVNRMDCGMYCTSGTMALRNTWLRLILPAGTPLARARRM